MGSFDGQDYFFNAWRLYYEEHKQLCASREREFATIWSPASREFIVNLMERSEIPFHLMARCNLTSRTFDWFDGHAGGYFYSAHGRLTDLHRRCTRSKEILFYDPLNMKRLPNPKGWFAGSVCVTSRNESLIVSTSSESSNIVASPIPDADSTDVDTTRGVGKDPSKIFNPINILPPVGLKEFENKQNNLRNQLDLLNQTISQKIDSIQIQVKGLTDTMKRFLKTQGILIIKENSKPDPDADQDEELVLKSDSDTGNENTSLPKPTDQEENEVVNRVQSRAEDRDDTRRLVLWGEEDEPKEEDGNEEEEGDD